MAESQAVDVVDELTTDHREALALLERIARSEDPGERRELTDTVIAEVVRHSVAEEMYVYPAMKDNLDDGSDTIAHDAEEHEQLERIMKQLESTDPGDRRFDSLVADMTSALRHHAEDEETEQFPQLRARLPQQMLYELRDEVAKAKSAAPTRPHPDAPNSALFHKLAGPGVGLVDRLRDRLTGRSS